MIYEIIRLEFYSGLLYNGCPIEKIVLPDTTRERDVRFLFDFHFHRKNILLDLIYHVAPIITELAIESTQLSNPIE